MSTITVAYKGNKIEVELDIVESSSRSMGEEFKWEAEYEGEVIIEIWEYPISAYNTHEFAPEVSTSIDEIFGTIQAFRNPNIDEL